VNSVTVQRDELLRRIKANREAHRSLFLAAQDGFRARVVEELDQMLQDARDGRKPIRLLVGLVEPQDHTKDYDRVIAMLEMSTESEVTVHEEKFQCYVMDDWAWKAAVFHANTTYATGGKLQR
jgi:hypothetical protein